MTSQSLHRIHQLSTGINSYFVNLFTPGLHFDWLESKYDLFLTDCFACGFWNFQVVALVSGIVCAQSTGWQYVAEILCLFQGELWILFTEPASPPKSTVVGVVYSLESPCSFFFWPPPVKQTQTEHGQTSVHQLHQCNKWRLSDSLSHLAMVACRAC